MNGDPEGGAVNEGLMELRRQLLDAHDELVVVGEIERGLREENAALRKALALWPHESFCEFACPQPRVCNCNRRIAEATLARIPESPPYNQILASEIYEFAVDCATALMGCRIPFRSEGRAGDLFAISVTPEDVKSARYAIEAANRRAGEIVLNER